MKNSFRFILAILFFLGFFTNSKASHIAGGDIVYTCLGGNTYQIRFNYYWDCGGAVDPPLTAATVDISSSCGFSGTTSLALESITEISQLCSSEIQNSECNGGSYPGLKRYSYVGTYTFSTCPTGTWTISYDENARNTSLNVPTSASSNFYIHAQLMRPGAGCNSSPQFIAPFPLPYICAGQPINYNYGTTEPNGDSIRYTFEGVRSAQNTFIAFGAGFSTTAPIPGITLNPLTGQINFTSPTTQGVYIVVVKVSEYDRLTGALKGVILRDIQFTVIPCTNNIPSATAGSITSFTITQGSATVSSPNTIESCEGNSFTWKTVYNDIDPGTILTMTTNASSVFPGITYTVSGTNPLTVTWTLTVPGGAAGPFGAIRSFSVGISDQSCPIPGMQTFTYNIYALPATYAGPDWGICGTQTANPIAVGGSLFTWYDLNNNLIPVNATSFTCNPCANPTIKPSAFGTYTFVVQSNLVSLGCKNRDTIIVRVADTFVSTLPQMDSLCLGESVILNANPIPAAAYTYSWQPATGLNNSLSTTPTATFTAGGNYTYTATITSPQGCTQQDNIVLRVSPNRAPLTPNIVQSHVICPGDATTLSVNYGNYPPASCGLSLSGPCAVINSYSMGSIGTNSANINETPFKGSQQDGKHFSVIRASELNAASISAGKINRISINVVTKASTIPYSNFTIKMGCTSLSSFVTGAYPSYNSSVVYSGNYSTVVGMNTFNFTAPYEWDGVSNLIVEICYDNTGTSGNDVISIANLTYPATIEEYANNSSGCGMTTTNTPLNNRPYFMIGWCPSTPNANSFNYTWSPATYLSATNIAKPVSTPSTLPFTYTVHVQDKVGGCEATDTHAILFSSPTLTTFTYPRNVYCKNEPNPTAIGTAIGVGTFAVSPPGLFFTSIVNGSINLNASVPGTYTIRNTTPAIGTCPSLITTFSMTILPVEVISFNYSSPIYCIGAGSSGVPVKANPAAVGTFTYTANPVSAVLGLNPNDGSINLNSSTVGTFTVTFTSGSICQSTYSRTVRVVGKPQGTFSYSNPYCKNGPNATITLNPGSISGTYTVVPSNAPVTFVSTLTGAINTTLSEPGSYTIRNYVINSFGCRDSADAILVITPPDVSSFSYGRTYFCNTGFADITIAPAYSGTYTSSSVALNIDANTGRLLLGSSIFGSYTVSFISGGPCPTTYSVPVVLRMPYSEFSYTPNVVCEQSGGTVPVAFTSYSVTTGSFSFPSGLIGNATTGDVDVNSSIARTTPYVVTFTAVEGTCSEKYTAAITIKPKDNASFYYPAPLCNNNYNGIPVITGVTGGTFSSTDLPSGSLDASSGKINLAGIIPGTYSVTYTSPSSPSPQYCSNSSKFIVTITEPKIATFTYSGPYCVNNASAIDALPTTINGYLGYFSSNNPNIDVDSLTGEIILENSVPNNTYIVTNTLPAQDGCLAVFDTTLVELIGTTASFDANPLSGVVPFNLYVVNNSTGAFDYVWNFGNNDSSTAVTPQYIYENSGDYIVTLTSKANETCVDTATAQIHVDNVSTIFIPTSFTPNGDGLNDQFRLGFSYLNSIDVKIFNRWGDMVANWQNEDGGWDGKYQGNDCASGVYVYKINYTTNTGEQELLQGTLMLLR